MSTRIEGPIVDPKPIKVYKGESFKLEVAVRDGLVAAGKKLGDLEDVSAASVSGVMRIDKPDGSTDVSKTATKVDSDGDGTEDAFRFAVEKTVTANWEEGFHWGEVEYQDSSASPEDAVLIYIFRIEVLTKPSEE